ncbi:MAG: T9SS type A sorting domain-containing protein [Bacteroidota bacterium]
MRKTLLLIGLMLFLGSLSQVSAQSTNSFIFEENFNAWTNDSVTLNGWSTVSNSSWNYISPSTGQMSFFKQSLADWVMLVTPGINLTGATSVIFDYQSGSGITGKQIQIGYMNAPGDTSSFTLLQTISVDNSNIQTDTVILPGITGVKYIGFNILGPIPYTYVYIDNVIVSDQNVGAHWPSFVTNLSASSASFGSNSAYVTWMNPSIEACGQPLTDLDSVVVYANGVKAFTLNNPVIGQPGINPVPVPSAGMYVFSVIAYNTAGASVSVSADTIWVGLDTPGPVHNLTMTVVNDSSSSLTWSPPTFGTHGAFYNNVVGNYVVIRADGTQFTLAGNVLNFSETLSTPGTYNYTVVPINATGQGTDTSSNAGAFYFGGFLLWEDFWVGAPAFGWSESGVSLYPVWHQGNGGVSGGTPPEAYMWPHSWEPFNGTEKMVSPPINTTGQTALSLDFTHSIDWNAGSFVLLIETTSDNGITWHKAWSDTVTQSLTAENLNVLFNTPDVGAPNMQFSFTFIGNSLNMNTYFIDALRLYPAVDVDIAAISLNIPEYLQPGDIITPSALIKSYGSLDTSYSATLQFMQGTNIVYNSVKTQSIVAGGTQLVNFDSWTVQEGDFVAHLTLSCPGDQNVMNNTKSKSFGAYTTVGNRTLVVCEDFTGTWCTYCPSAAMGLDELVANNWPVAVISYHGGDPYETTEAAARNTFYDITGYPTVVFDGLDQVVGGNQGQSMYPSYVPYVQARLAMQVNANVAIFNMDLVDSTLTGNVALQSGSPILNPSLKLLVLITESHIPEAWQNMTELNYVERAIFGGPFGVAVDLSSKHDTISFSMTKSQLWNQQNMELVAFLQDTITKQIYNGCKMSLANVGIAEIEPIVSMYPNPASDVFMIQCDKRIEQIEIYNLLGEIVNLQKVSSLNPVINVAALPAGLYIVRIKTPQAYADRKLIKR